MILFSKKLFNNKYLIGAFGIGFVFITAVLMIPGLHNVFKVVTLDGGQFLTVCGLAILNLPVIQVLRAVRKGWRKQK